LPFLLVDLKGIRAITLNKTELFHVFFIYQEIFIRKYVLVKYQSCPICRRGK